jgi:3-oxo-5-alpha-steroid 4-dehydrogenase 1
MQKDTFYLLLWLWTAVGLAAFILLLFVTAPYGRHSRKDWGPVIPNRVGWIMMEFPSLLVFILAFLLGPRGIQPVTWIFFALYVFHYGNRSVLYPLRTHTAGKMMPLVVALLAVFFNLVNGFINGYWFSAFAREYTVDWLWDVRFVIGAALFLAGVVINWQSDQVLLDLRKGGEKGYSIPRGGLFRWVSCPNFLGEIIEWTGFAILTWSPAALVFALWTFFNLVPRAMDHHKWYRATFEEYPPKRKALIPYLL